MNAGPDERRRATLATAALSAGVAAAMAGAAFAAVPLYDLFCRATGYGGTTQRAEKVPAAPLDRMVTVRFDANVAPGLPWSFRPESREIRVRLGELGETRFLARNLTAGTTAGTATFNVTPEQAGVYFNKIACFCFTEQELRPGEAVEMPVQFFVDPALAAERGLDFIDTITLSYSFFPAARAKPAPVASAPPGGKPL